MKVSVEIEGFSETLEVNVFCVLKVVKRIFFNIWIDTNIKWKLMNFVY